MFYGSARTRARALRPSFLNPWIPFTSRCGISFPICHSARRSDISSSYDSEPTVGGFRYEAKPFVQFVAVVVLEGRSLVVVLRMDLVIVTVGRIFVVFVSNFTYELVRKRERRNFAFECGRSICPRANRNCFVAKIVRSVSSSSCVLVRQ